MNRMNNEEEREWASLVSRITAGQDWWTSSTKPIPERIWFQRFGVQLRDEDFQQDGTVYRGFLIRDRTEARLATSGFSAVKNNDQEFKVAVDVWPFQHGELVVVIVPGLYIKIDGEHKEKCEDNSECTRKFTRRYLLPKGCASTVKACNYNKGILTISVEKSEIADKEEKQQKVPITLESWKNIRSKPFESNNDVPVTLGDPKEVAITGDDSKRSLTEDDETSKAALAAGGSSEVDPGEVKNPKVPMTSDDSKVDPKEVVKTPKAVRTANDDPKVAPCEVEMEKASTMAKDILKIDSEVVDETSIAEPIANDDSNVDVTEVVTPKVVETPRCATKTNDDSKVDLKEVIETAKAAPIANGDSKVDPGEVETRKVVDYA